MFSFFNFLLLFMYLVSAFLFMRLLCLYSQGSYYSNVLSTQHSPESPILIVVDVLTQDTEAPAIAHSL